MGHVRDGKLPFKCRTTMSLISTFGGVLEDPIRSISSSALLAALQIPSVLTWSSSMSASLSGPAQPTDVRSHPRSMIALLQNSTIPDSGMIAQTSTSVVFPVNVCWMK